jgi:putative ATP-binding cassette transporter
MRKGLRFLADLWALMRPYFVSSEWKSAWALLVLLIALNLAQVGLGLALSFSRNIFFTALQTKDAAGFFRGLFWFTPRPHGLPMPGFFYFGIVLIIIGALGLYVQSVLQIRWRRWMTNRLSADWLAGDAHYRMRQLGDAGTGTDNPDQRIQEDVDEVTNNSLSFTTGIISNVVTIVSYGGLLWALSGRTVVFGISIPGALVWAALIYSALVTWLTHLTGRRIASLTFVQQRLVGDFRFSLVRVRENGEAVALYGSAAEEERGLVARFRAVYRNAIQIINRTAWVTFVTGVFGTVSDNFVLVAWSPRFFAGRITFGTLMQINQLFGDLQGAFLWFMNQYAALAAYAAQVERLATFQRAVAASRAPAALPAAGPDWRVEGLVVPAGDAALGPLDLTLERGVSTAIMGASGVGKTSLFRVMAGIRDAASGAVRPGAGSRMFLPQSPYIPTGTLRRAVCYPLAAEAVDAARLGAAMEAVGLGILVGRLDEDGAWAETLSPGQQQRVAIARVLLVEPDWLFLDEATSGLDEASEAAIYRLLAERLPMTTIVSITHNRRVAGWHRRVVELETAASL